MIDEDGYRPNVGIVLCNDRCQVFWGRRVGQEAWQFPQGGIKASEAPEEAMFRELEEEVGLLPQHVEVLGHTRGWLKYRLPQRYIRRYSHPICIGQKQIWFLLRLRCPDTTFCLDKTHKPEFDYWRWVKYWYPVREVVFFKRRVYSRALQELCPLLNNNPAPVLIEDRESVIRTPQVIL